MYAITAVHKSVNIAANDIEMTVTAVRYNGYFIWFEGTVKPVLSYPILLSNNLITYAFMLRRLHGYTCMMACALQ